MADYLQDIIDRSMAYQDPATLGINIGQSGDDPFAAADEKLRKKRQPLPLPPAQAAQPTQWLPPGVQPSTTIGPAIANAAGAIGSFLSNPANPSYGASPMSPDRPVTPTTPAPAMPPAGVLPKAQPFPDVPPPETPTQPSIPLPRPRPDAAPPREDVREADGSRLQDVRQTQLSTAGQGAGMLGGFGDWLGQHSNTLLAMGAGMLGAPTLAAGLGRGFAYAGPAAQADIARQTQLGGQQAAYNALVTAGVPHDLAVAGATNPKIMDKLMENYVTGNKYTVHNVEKTNSWGEKTTTPIAINERDPSDAYYVETGQPVHPSTAATKGPQIGTVVQGPGGTSFVPQPSGGGGGGGQPAAAGGQPAATGAPGQAPSQFYAPGVTDDNYSESLPPDEYLAQFSPSVQAQIKDRVNGLVPASASGRNPQQLRLQRAAELYGQGIGLPMDAATVGQRKAWANSLGDTKSGVGLQVKGLQQGLEHFSRLSDVLVKMNLSNGMGVEKIAKGLNWLKSGTTAQKENISQVEFLSGALAKEMGNLSGKGSGVAERAKTEELLGNALQSGQSAAGSLKGVVDIMGGGLGALEQRRDELFPDPRLRPRGSDFMGPKEQAELANIQKNIAILEGKQPRAAAAPAAAPAAPAFEPGKRYTVDAQGRVVNQ